MGINGECDWLVYSQPVSAGISSSTFTGNKRQLGWINGWNNGWIAGWMAGWCDMMSLFFSQELVSWDILNMSKMSKSKQISNKNSSLLDLTTLYDCFDHFSMRGKRKARIFLVQKHQNMLSTDIRAHHLHHNNDENITTSHPHIWLLITNNSPNCDNHQATKWLRKRE